MSDAPSISPKRSAAQVSESLCWIAVDWGTSNLRVWALSGDNSIIATASSERGMAALGRDEFEPALLDLISDWLPEHAITSVFACGMVGAKQGWIEAPYTQTPCLPAQSATLAPTSDPRIAVQILPGVCQNEPADVMRGEETQIAGFLSDKPDWCGAICLPGTHAKWVLIEGGQIARFQTYMTGELFSAIQHNTVLRHSLTGDGWDEEAFREAVLSALENPVLAAGCFFRIRADGLLHGQGNGAGRARLSGTLIGIEMSAAREFWNDQTVMILGEGELSRRYAQALQLAGSNSSIKNIETYTLAGITRAQVWLHSTQRAG